VTVTAGDLRTAADLLERIAQHYGFGAESPFTKLSASGLRDEANYLEEMGESNYLEEMRLHSDR